MKFLILASCLCMAVAVQGARTAVPTADKTVSRRAAGSDATAEVVRSDSDVRADGFSYGYETSNHISGEASGTLKKIGDESSVVVKGSYEYIADDGTPVKVSYIADENGYQPQGDVLPTPPPIPAQILAALKYIKEHPYTEPVTSKRAKV